MVLPKNNNLGGIEKKIVDSARFRINSGGIGKKNVDSAQILLEDWIFCRIFTLD
ncbi:MAG: hypothetical protein K6F33_01075 [Bacteroidales bacterium]|nr:hypothetical protein [Bacteroidales bacterium]